MSLERKSLTIKIRKEQHLTLNGNIKAIRFNTFS